MKFERKKLSKKHVNYQDIPEKTKSQENKKSSNLNTFGIRVIYASVENVILQLDVTYAM